MVINLETRTKRERRLNIIYNSIAGCIAITLTVIVMAIVGGESLDGFLAMIGLHGVYNRESGVYADCSLKANENNAYCDRGRRKVERSWKSLDSQGARPFSLSGR